MTDDRLLLDVRELTVRFPTSDGVVQAVSDVSFSLSRGETLGVVGESGSGKSVSNLAIMGLLNRQRTAIAGEVLFKGRDLLTLPPDDLRHIRGKEIAMALVHNPDILICDEPTTALDVTVQAQIVELIEEVKREFDIGVILVTHDLGVVAETANSVMVMYAGRIMEYGPADEIFERPQHPYAWGLLDSTPSIERRLDALVPIDGSPPSLLAPPSGCPFHPRCRYRFEPCPTERPPLVAPVPEAHLDACHLPWDEKVREGTKRSVRNVGEAA